MTQETHNTSNQTKGSVSNECRVTGFTLGVTALIIGSSLALIGTLNPYLDLPLLQGFAPTIEQMLSLESFLFAAIYGVTMLSALRYMEFYWIKKIKAERFTIIITVLPVLAFVFEYYADKIGLVEFTGLTIMQAVFGGLAVMAAAIIEISEARAARNQVNKISQLSKKEIEQIDIDHQIASLTLQTAGDDKKKAAKMLEIGVKVLDKALEAPNTGNALSNEMSYRLRTSFSNNVAMIDALTGLMNKTQFYSIFQSVLRRGDQGILLYIDLNKFKPVNDTFGHNAGDEVLKVIASRMKANTGRNSIHARLGGDEFAILLTNTNTAEGEKIRDRLNSKIAEPIKIDGIDESLCVGASTGIALFPEDGNRVEELIHIADQAMYQEKNK
jgi:diguanylate cyclase (GGDEF)-like protein